MGNYSDQQATEFWVMFRKIEAQLWVVAGKVNGDDLVFAVGDVQ